MLHKVLSGAVFTLPIDLEDRVGDIVPLHFIDEETEPQTVVR